MSRPERRRELREKVKYFNWRGFLRENKGMRVFRKVSFVKRMRLMGYFA